jgi:hypothetical protein
LGQDGTRAADPIAHVSEVLLGLFVVLTLTDTLSVLDNRYKEVRSMLAVAIGCSIAWGFVDAVMCVLRNLVARGRRATLVGAVRSAGRPQQARRLSRDEIGRLSAALATTGIEGLRQRIVAQPAPEEPLAVADDAVALHPAARAMVAGAGPSRPNAATACFGRRRRTQQRGTSPPRIHRRATPCFG